MIHTAHSYRCKIYKCIYTVQYAVYGRFVTILNYCRNSILAPTAALSLSAYSSLMVAMKLVKPILQHDATPP